MLHAKSFVFMASGNDAQLAYCTAIAGRRRVVRFFAQKQHMLSLVFEAKTWNHGRKWPPRENNRLVGMPFFNCSGVSSVASYDGTCPRHNRFGLSPGPAVLATVGRSLAHGFVSGIFFIFGIILADFLFSLLAMLGLAQWHSQHHCFCS